MEIHIGGRSFSLDWSFDFKEKVSVLRKSNLIKFRLVIYTDTKILDEKEQGRLDYFSSLQSLPEMVYFSKAGLYFWCFEGCALADKSVVEDTDYKYRIPSAFSGESRKYCVSISMSYSDVWGTGDEKAVARAIKLRGIIG